MSRIVRRVLGAAVAAVMAIAPVAVRAAGPAFSAPAGLPPLPPLYGVTCPTATTCYAAGGGVTGTIASTTDGGRSWSVTEVRGIAQLNDVACLGPTHCVAVGGNGTSGASTAAAAFTTDGHSWTVVASMPTAPLLTSVSCVAGSRCMAVGASNPTGSSGFVAAALFTFDGGASWSQAATPTFNGQDTLLNEVSCPEAQTCYAVGGGVWVTKNFGGTWTDVAPSRGCANQTQGFCAPTYSDLAGVDFTSASDGAVGGGDECGGPGVTQCAGAFFSTTNGGASWTGWPSSDRKLAFLVAVLCSGLRCLALSDAVASSKVIASTDGSSWNAVGSSGGRLDAITCAASGPCVAVGNNGTAGVVLTSAAGLAAIGGGAATPASPAASSGSGSGAGGVAVASAFSTSIPTPASVGSSVPALLLSALLVLGLVLLVVFPSQLFNRTFEENHERIRAWWERRLPWTRAVRDRAQARALRGAAGLAAAVAAGGVLGTLLDPQAGFNSRSAALFLGIVLALLFSIALGAAVSAAYRRARGRETRWEPRALPSGLLVAAACVLVSRAVSFQPGYLYGIIGGIAFAGALPRREEGHLVALSSTVTLVVAVVAWLLWVPAATAARTPGAGFGSALYANVLSALFVGGLAGVVIGLVPLRFLPGEKLAAWHWGAWAAMFAVAMFGLVQIMLRPQSTSAHVASVPLWTTVGLFLAFGTASVAFWAYFRATPARRPGRREPRLSR